MLYRAQQFGIDARQPRQRARIQAIIFAPALGDQAHLLCVSHDHFVPSAVNHRLTQGECVPVSIAMRPRGMLPNTCFIQDAVRTGAISQIQSNGQLPLENVSPTRPHSANLLHCRSPFLCASSTSIIGSVSHPVGDRPSPFHLINALPEKCRGAIFGRISNDASWILIAM
jgi:hypothetical protein